jgi:hypothetical protein
VALNAAASFCSADMTRPRFPTVQRTKVAMNDSTALFLFCLRSTLVTYLLALQPTPLWRLLGFGVVTAVSGLLLLTASTGHSVRDYVVGCAITHDFFATLSLLCFTNALDEFRHEKDVGHPRQWPMTQRMIWTSRLLSSSRGIGWNDQVDQFRFPAATIH